MVGFFLGALWSGQVLSANLKITVENVLDLATYGDAKEFSIPLNEGQQKTEFQFEAKDWGHFFPHEGFHYEIKGHVTPIEQEQDSYFVDVQKVLYHDDEVVKTLLHARLVLKAGDDLRPMIEKSNPLPYAPTSFYWHHLHLVMRQLDMIAIAP